MKRLDQGQDWDSCNQEWKRYIDGYVGVRGNRVDEEIIQNACIKHNPKHRVRHKIIANKSGSRAPKAQRDRELDDRKKKCQKANRITQRDVWDPNKLGRARRQRVSDYLKAQKQGSTL